MLLNFPNMFKNTKDSFEVQGLVLAFPVASVKVNEISRVPELI